MFWDVLRVLLMLLYGLIVAETVYTGVLYGKFTYTRGMRQLLPCHVWMVSIGVLILASEAAWQNATRIHTGFSPYIIINAVAFYITYVSIRLIRVHTKRRWTRGV